MASIWRPDSNASVSSCELSLSYSVSDAGSESIVSSDSPDEAIEPYLYEPDASDSSTALHEEDDDDDSQDSQRLLSTDW